MKSMMNDTNTDDGNNHHNWLGFSLSPHMKMGVTTSGPPHHHHYHQQQQQVQASAPVSNSTVPTTFYMMSPNSHMSNNSGICYGVGDNASPFHSPLTVMPLKSDGSLCIMEALTRSQQTQVMVPTSSPKLEDFLGGATIGTHDYGTHQREAMALSLDSIYYAQNAAAESHQPNRDHSLDLLSESFRQQGNPYYSALGCHNMYQPPLQEQQPKPTHANNNVCGSQMPQIAEEEEAEAEEGIGCLKSLVAPRDHHQYQGLEQQVNSGNIGGVGCGELQSLSLSMSPGSQSSCVTVPNRQISPSGNDSVAAIMDGKKRGSAKLGGQKQPVHRKSIDTFGQRTSQYRGVTRHRWTGRYEAHLWDNSCKKEGQTRKGRQVYLGGYDMEEKAARAYDLAALKYWGPSTHINFPLENYQAELEEMKNMSRQEYVAHLRRKSSGFSRGASMYRGVTRHHQHGRWQARIGRVAGNKDLYLGTFSTQEEAAEAYDVAAIKFRGVNAVTNFDISRYDVERIMASNTLLAGEMARRNKESEPRTLAIEYNNNSVVSSQGNGEAVQARHTNNNENDSEWKMALYQHHPQQQQSNNSSSNNNNECDQKSMNCGNYRSPVFSVALQDLIGIDSTGGCGSGQPQMLDECSKIGGGTSHFSNPSSLVTSLSSSREASPDKMGPSMLFPKPSVETKIVNPLGNGVTSWFPSQMRPSAAISLSHLPVFAAWNDT